MKNMTLIATAVVGALFSANALAAEVKVEWKDVDSYRDIEGVNTIQSEFEKRVMDELTAHWQELGAKLPEDHNLAITMTDLDIAGRVEPTFGTAAVSSVRILDELSYPSMSFAFTYTDGSGALIAENSDVRLRDLGARSGTIRSVMGSGRDSFYFEKRLMDKWFNEQFPKQAD